MKYSVFCLLASVQSIKLPTNNNDKDIGMTHIDPWVRIVSAANVNPVPMGGRATSPDGAYVNPTSVGHYASDWSANAQISDPIEESHRQMLAQGNNWPNTKWAPPQPNFKGAPEKVLVPDPVAYASRANTPSYLGNKRTTFYAQSEQQGNNWPDTKWAPPQPNFSGQPEKVLVPDPVAYASRANTPSYLGNRRTTFYAQGDDQPEGTNQGVNQLIVTQKDKRWQENRFRKAFPPKNQSVPQWNAKVQLQEDPPKEDSKKDDKGEKKDEKKPEKVWPAPEKVQILDPIAYQTIANAAGRTTFYPQRARLESNYNFKGE